MNNLFSLVEIIAQELESKNEQKLKSKSIFLRNIHCMSAK